MNFHFTHIKSLSSSLFFLELLLSILWFISSQREVQFFEVQNEHGLVETEKRWRWWHGGRHGSNGGAMVAGFAEASRWLGVSFSLLEIALFI